jgi:membrane protein DedA with SNARE-associated domain
MLPIAVLPNANDPADLGGILGFSAVVIQALGEWGVGLMIVIETLFPPIPSEIVLSLAGFLSRQGEMTLPLVIVTSTLGSYLGAILLYSLGHALGRDRAIRWLSKLPLVEESDFVRASDWFEKHGTPAVFFGRFVPGVRSVISLPAGAAKMNFATFSLATVAGSAIWNSILIGFGYALGSQYELVEQYSDWLNYAVYAVLAGLLVWLVVRRVRKGRRDTVAE